MLAPGARRPTLILRPVWTTGFATAILTMSCRLLAGVDDATVEKVRQAISTTSPHLTIDRLQATPATGIFRAELGGEVVYVTGDGRYALSGDLYDLASRKNLSEESRKQGRSEALAEVSPASAVIFAPPEPQFWITVFTDVDCPYCRKLHTDIDQFLALGVGVRYLAFPRAGAGSDSWVKMESVWCAADRRAALTQAKRGDVVARTDDCQAPEVAQQFLLGERFGIQGTPTILLEDGSMISGYIEPAKLVVGLQEVKKSGAAPP